MVCLFFVRRNFCFMYLRAVMSLTSWFQYSTIWTMHGLTNVSNFLGLVYSQFHGPLFDYLQSPSDSKEVYLQTWTHYVWVWCLWTKQINLTHQGYFLMPDSQNPNELLLNKWLTKIQFSSWKYSKKALNIDLIS